jgi:hypothetical protein
MGPARVQGFRLRAVEAGDRVAGSRPVEAAAGERRYTRDHKALAQVRQSSSQFSGSPFTCAVVALVAPPAAAPSPLPIFGAAAAFGASRQLRKRIKRIGHSLSNTYGL